MADPAKKRATYQDILDAPEHVVAEIVGGVLHLSPRPGYPHGAAQSVLGYALGPPFHLGHGGPGGWIILSEPELHFGEDVVVPDLGGWRRERMAAVPEEHFTTVAPDWICEVLSKSSEKFDRAEKLRVYAAAGVQYAWLVHPVRRTLEAMRLNDGAWLVIGVYKDDDRARIAPFDAIELELDQLWSDQRPMRAGETAAQYELSLGG